MKKSLTVLGKKWKVKLVKQPLCDDGSPAFGICDGDNKTILIKSGMTDLQTERVFWHEYMHARLYEAGVIQNTGGLNDLAEEIICDTFADLMTQELAVKWRRKKL